MSEFQTYLDLGIEHITDLKGYDHILFILILCVVYELRQWKHLLILITAFTIGHSITLALATFNILSINSDLIEFLIPVTIFATAFGNLFQKPERGFSPIHKLKYLFTLFFGLIHGLGFSYYLKVLLTSESNLVLPLFSFNLGVEIGQLILVIIFIIISFIFRRIFRVSNHDWNLVVSGAGLGISLILALQRWPF